MSIADVTTIIGTAGVILSLLLLSWQTRRLSQQTAVGNAVAKINSHFSAVERMHAIYGLLAAAPDLQPYFLDRKACPPHDPNRLRAVMVAQMLADVHDLGLELTRRFPDPVHQDCWVGSTLEFLKQPMLKEVFQWKKPWWPELNLFFAATNTEFPSVRPAQEAQSANG